MPVLKNARHERFAQEIAQGKSATEAYALAGYKPHDGNAATLRGNQKVTARLTELLQGAAEKAETTAADIARQLDEDRALAREVKVPSAAVSATMGKAKLFGLIKERHEHTGANGGPIKHDLSGVSDDQLAVLEGILSGAVAYARGGQGGNPAKGSRAK